MKHIVTDMGGVIIDLYWEQNAAKIFKKDFTIDELHKLWITSNATKNYETGKISFDEFAIEAVKDFNLSITPEEVKKHFCAIVGPPKERFHELFTKLKKHFTLSLLSNTNPAHIEFLRKKYDIFQMFDHLFYSYEIGFMKPSEEIFKFVIDKLNTKPENILFFDDSSANVSAAEKTGIQAFKVNSPLEIYDISIQHI